MSKTTFRQVVELHVDNLMKDDTRKTLADFQNTGEWDNDN